MIYKKLLLVVVLVVLLVCSGCLKDKTKDPTTTTLSETEHTTMTTDNANIEPTVSKEAEEKAIKSWNDTIELIQSKEVTGIEIVTTGGHKRHSVIISEDKIKEYDLIERLLNVLPKMKVSVTDSLMINGSFKNAYLIQGDEKIYIGIISSEELSITTREYTLVIESTDEIKDECKALFSILK